MGKKLNRIRKGNRAATRKTTNELLYLAGQVTLTGDPTARRKRINSN